MKKETRKLRLNKNVVMVLSERLKRHENGVEHIKTNIRLSCPTMCTPMIFDPLQRD
jgi:hypothetical protein